MSFSCSKLSSWVLILFLLITYCLEMNLWRLPGIAGLCLSHGGSSAPLLQGWRFHDGGGLAPTVGGPPGNEPALRETSK